MRAAFGAGDFRLARSLAASVTEEADGAAAWAEASRLLERSAVDSRALVIGAGAAFLGIFYAVAFILLR